MTNSNCLENLRCPQCSQEERLQIVARIMCVVTDGGSEPFGDHDWDDESICSCPVCGCTAELKAFRLDPDLPPDLEGMNGRRAMWAASALAAFRDATGADEVDALSDLLGDLMHWCDRNGASFAAQMERARWHYDAETGGENS